MNYKEFLTEFFGKTLNIPAEKVTSLLTEDGKEVKAEALTELLSLDAAKVQKFKNETIESFENGKKKATKDIMVDFEKKIKEKYAVTSDKKGDELFDEIITLKSNDKSAIDETKVKTHEAYTRMQQELNQKIVETENNWKTKFETQQREIAEKSTFSNVLKKSDTFLSGFALPENEVLKANQKRLLALDLEQYKFEQQGEEILVKDKEGKLLMDEHGNRVTFEALNKQIASKYWLPINGQARQGAAGANNTGAQGQAGANIWKGKVTNDAEYTKAIQGAKEAKERIAIQDAYNEHKAAANGGK